MDTIDVKEILSNEELKEYIHKLGDDVNWESISIYSKLSENFIREFKDKVQWMWISTYQKLSEDFIREFKDEVFWSAISECQKLSEDFIREFKDKVWWHDISRCQKLSEDFIREFKDKVYWMHISQYQKLSEDFIIEFKDKVEWYYISRHQKLSENFIEEFKNKISIGSVLNSWHYMLTEFKKQQVVDTELYECYDDYFIAYKGIRDDRYSYHNFHYQYLKDETYETFADYSREENSFGFSVWTEEEAKDYCDELIVRCKVYYEDVARVLDKGNIRCCKLTILD